MQLEELDTSNHVTRLKDLIDENEAHHKLADSARTLLAIRNTGMMALLSVHSQEIAVVCYEHPASGVRMVENIHVRCTGKYSLGRSHYVDSSTLQRVSHGKRYVLV